MSLHIDHENTDREPLMDEASDEYTITGKLLSFPLAETSGKRNFFVFKRENKGHDKRPCVRGKIACCI